MIRRLGLLVVLSAGLWAYLGLTFLLASHAPYKYVAADLYFDRPLGPTPTLDMIGGDTLVSLACEPIAVRGVAVDWAVEAGFACVAVGRGEPLGELVAGLMRQGWPHPQMARIRAGMQYWPAPTPFPWLQLSLQLLLAGGLAASVSRTLHPAPVRQASWETLLPAAVACTGLVAAHAIFGEGPAPEGCHLAVPDPEAVAMLLLVAPIAEELLYREWGYRLLRRAFSVRWTIILTAAAFAFMHHERIAWSYPGLAVLQFLTFLSGGLALGLVRWRTGSVVPCMAAHALTNLLLLPVRACF